MHIVHLRKAHESLLMMAMGSHNLELSRVINSGAIYHPTASYYVSWTSNGVYVTSYRGCYRIYTYIRMKLDALSRWVCYRIYTTDKMWSGTPDQIQDSGVLVEATVVECGSRMVKVVEHVSVRGASGHHHTVHPARINHVNVGVLLKEMAEQDPLVSRAKALQLRLAKHHQQGMLSWYVMDGRWLSRVCYVVVPPLLGQLVKDIRRHRHCWARYERLWLKALLVHVQAKMVTDGGCGTTCSQLRQDRVQFR